LAYGVKGFVFGLDGMTEKIHDSIRRKKGSFKKVLEAVKWSKLNRFHTGLHITLIKQNYKQLEKYLEYATTLNLNELLIGNLILAGLAYKNREKLFLSDEEKEKCFTTCKKYIPYFQNTFFSFPYSPFQYNLPTCNYLNGNNFCVDWNGKSSPCPSIIDLKLPFPSLETLPLKEYFCYIDEVRQKFKKDRERKIIFQKPKKKFINCSDYCVPMFRQNYKKYLNIANF